MTSVSPNAKTREETVANGPDTFGVRCSSLRRATSDTDVCDEMDQVLNQHPTAAQSVGSAFKVGVSVDRNKKCRRTMEEYVLHHRRTAFLLRSPRRAHHRTQQLTPISLQCSFLHLRLWRNSRSGVFRRIRWPRRQARC